MPPLKESYGPTYTPPTRCNVELRHRGSREERLCAICGVGPCFHHNGELSSKDLRGLPAEQFAAIFAVLMERRFQDNKHGTEGHSIGAWLLILRKELEEAEDACIKGGTGRDNVISEIIQVAAVAIACLEQHGVKPIERRSV